MDISKCQGPLVCAFNLYACNLLADNVFVTPRRNLPQVSSLQRFSSQPACFGQFHRCALVAGHPGHELKVFGWLAEYQPRVYVITDGSGRSGISRIPSTAALLQNAGARSGDIFGAISDAEIYRAILEQDVSWFL